MKQIELAEEVIKFQGKWDDLVNQIPAYNFDHINAQIGNEQLDAQHIFDMANEIRAALNDLEANDQAAFNKFAQEEAGGRINVQAMLQDMDLLENVVQAHIDRVNQIPRPERRFAAGRNERGLNAQYDMFRRAANREATPELNRTQMVGDAAEGTLDASGAAPIYYSQIWDDGYNMWIQPMLDTLLNEFNKADRSPLAGDIKNLDADGKNMLDGYLRNVKDEQASSKYAAIKLGEHLADMSLLDYTKRYNLDNALGLGFPYHFWWTHSMMNWSFRAMDRPAFLGWFGKLAQFSDKNYDEYSNMPSRLRGKMRFPVPFMPEWAGGGVWTDPLSKFFPILEFLRPFDRVMQQTTRNRRTAEYAIIAKFRAGEITAEEANDAILNQEGDIWRTAMQGAKTEEGGDAFDYMSMFVSPALYLQIPYKLLTGKGEQLSPLPMSKTIQGFATATGIDPLRLFDLEGNIRKALGVSEFGEWGPYYVDRQLANMAVEMPERTNEIRLAMIEKQGELYDEAYRRVQFEMMMRQPGMSTVYSGRQALEGEAGLNDILASMVFGWLPAHLLPPAEMEQRGLKKGYDEAWDAYHAGDREAIDTWLAEHPEYQARLALWDGPEERMRKFLVDAVWESYHSLPDLYQKQVREQLPDFTDRMLNQETKDVDGISDITLATWASQMGAMIPGSLDTPQGEIEYAAPNTAVLYQKYRAEKEAQFPGIYEIQQQYFSVSEAQQEAILATTPLADYWAWNHKQKANHPELIPYLTSEESSMYGVPEDQQWLYHSYKANFAALFPDYYDQLDDYFAPGANKKAYLQANPTLKDAWNYENQFLTQFPQMIPYLESEKRIGEKYMDADYNQQNYYDTSEFTGPLISSLSRHFITGGNLSPGAMKELSRIYYKSGRPGEDFESWLEGLEILFTQ